MGTAAASGARRASSRKKTSTGERVIGRCKEEDNRLGSSDAGEDAVGGCGEDAVGGCGKQAGGKGRPSPCGHHAARRGGLGIPSKRRHDLILFGNSCWRSCEKTTISSAARGPYDRAPSAIVSGRPEYLSVVDPGGFVCLLPRRVTGPHLLAAVLEELPFPISLHRRETAVSQRRQSRASTGERQRRSGGAGGDLVVLAGRGGGGGLGRWSAKVVCGEGGGVGQRRGSRRHRAAPTMAPTTAHNPPCRSILHGAASSTAQHLPRRSIKNGAASRTVRDLHGVFSGKYFSWLP
jgi:hypothetical protein